MPTPTATPVDPKLAFGSKSFEPARSGLLDALGKDSNVKSVDKFIYDPASGSVVLDITSTWASLPNQETGAWEITRSLALLWKTGNPWNAPGFAPAFAFTNSGTAHRCAGDFMVKLGNTEASRADWAAACR